jgi:hypothetical protein
MVRSGRSISSRFLFWLGCLLVAPGLWAESVQGPKVYGKVNLSLEAVDNEGAGASVRGRAPAEVDQWELNSNGSRVGVKGSLPLDDSRLTAIYQAEFEVYVDDGDRNGSTFSQRDIFVGVKGDFGQLRAGRMVLPLRATEGKIDHFNDLRGDLGELIAGQNRSSNVVEYQSPKFCDAITAKFAFIPAEGDDAEADGEEEDGVADTISSSIVFDDGHYYAALAYDQDQDAQRSVDGLERGDILRGVVALKQDALELGALVQQVKDAAPDSELQDTSYFLSTAYTLGRVKLKAQYGYSEGDVTGEVGKLYAAGVDYSLSKNAVLFGYCSGLSLGEAGLDDRTLGVGMVLKY